MRLLQLRRWGNLVDRPVVAAVAVDRLIFRSSNKILFGQRFFVFEDTAETFGKLDNGVRHNLHCGCLLLTGGDGVCQIQKKRNVRISRSGECDSESEVRERVGSR